MTCQDRSVSSVVPRFGPVVYFGLYHQRQLVESGTVTVTGPGTGGQQYKLRALYYSLRDTMETC